MDRFNTDVVLLYSGGSDSTLASVLLLEKFKNLRLITFSRFGLSNINNSSLNAEKLKNKYPGRVTHEIINIDKIFKFISYERYIKNLYKYGFFNLSTCGLCKLAMHIRAAIYCIDNRIEYIADGANKAMYMFPDQQNGYIDMLKKFYSKLKIKYENPVFDFESPPDIDFVDKFRLDGLPGLEKEHNAKFYETKEKTTEHKLYELGLMPTDRIKGTDIDRKMQARCFQFVLFNIWLYWYYLPFKSTDQYFDDVISFYSDKMNIAFSLVEEYSERKEYSKIYKYL
ncbi:MAG: hypothetical protein KA059_03055 [Elusimicrobiales bacterium]|nr:hypothetical protein [Elusimicrobiales bacterium]